MTVRRARGARAGVRELHFHRGDRHAHSVPFLTSTLLTGYLPRRAISQWYGGELVDRHGMRVQPAGGERDNVARLPGDERAVHALYALTERAPAGGPTL